MWRVRRDLGRPPSTLHRTPNEEQILEAIQRSRKTKSFIDRAYENLDSVHDDELEEEESEEEEREETQLALPAIVTKRTMSPSYGANGPAKRMTRAEKKKKVVRIHTKEAVVEEETSEEMLSEILGGCRTYLLCDRSVLDASSIYSVGIVRRDRQIKEKSKVKRREWQRQVLIAVTCFPVRHSPFITPKEL